MFGIESIVSVDAGCEGKESHDRAIGAMDVESQVITVSVDGDAETLLYLEKGEDIGNGMGAIPHRAKVSDVPHLCGRVRAAIGVNDVRVRAGPNIGEEGSVAKDAGGGASVKEDPRCGKAAREGGIRGRLRKGVVETELGKREMTAELVGGIGKLGKLVCRGGGTVRGRRMRGPTCWCRGRRLAVVGRGSPVFVLGLVLSRRFIVDQHLVGVYNAGRVLVGATAKLIPKIRLEAVVFVAGVLDEKSREGAFLGLSLGKVNQGKRGSLLFVGSA